MNNHLAGIFICHRILKRGYIQPPIFVTLCTRANINIWDDSPTFSAQGYETKTLAKSTSPIVASAQDLETLPPKDLFRGEPQDPFRTLIPEDDPMAAIDDESAIICSRKRLK